MEFFLVLFLNIIILVSSEDTLPEVCKLQHSANSMFAGLCFGNAYSAWSYDKDKDLCIEFHYGGCGGNHNRFFTMEQCEEICKNGED